MASRSRLFAKLFLVLYILPSIGFLRILSSFPEPLWKMGRRNTDPTLPTTKSRLAFHQANNQSTTVVVPNPNRAILHVHVGKCGGSTINVNLYRRKCWYFWYRDEKPCPNTKKGEEWIRNEESTLSRHTFGSAHIEDMEWLAYFWVPKFTTLMYSVRDPIDRVASAFAYLQSDTYGSDEAKRTYKSKTDFYNCFPDLQALLSSVASPSPQQSSSSSCHRMGIDTLRGEGHRNANIHLYYNFQKFQQLAFLRPNSWRVSNNENVNYEILVIRQENLWQDLKDLDRQLGGTAIFPLEGVQKRKTRKRGKGKKPLNQTIDVVENDNDIHNLCCILYKEYQAFQDIILWASNLNHRQKVDTIETAYARCNVSKDQQTKTSLSSLWSNWYEESCPDYYDREITGIELG